MAERGYERRACVRRQQDSVANLAGRLHLRGKLGAVRGSCDQAAVALIGLPCYCLAWCGASGGNVAVVVGLPGIGVQRERRGRGGPRRAARGRTGGRERGAALKKKGGLQAARRIDEITHESEEPSGECWGKAGQQENVEDRLGLLPRVGSEGCSSSLKRTFGDRARSKKPCNAGVKSAESRSTTA